MFKFLASSAILPLLMVAAPALAQTPNSVKLNSFTDASGLVTVSVFERKGGTAQQHWTNFRIDVGPDMIAIGGGAEAVRLPEGALLTASYPSDDIRAWIVSSKDHLRAQPHRLIGYAIGLQVKGMTREELVQAIHINTASSGVGQHPEAAAKVPSGFALVSGGFRIEWSGAGSLATASFPESNFSWKARAKDHAVESPANLIAYAIAIQENLPVGQVKVGIHTHGSEQAHHPESAAEVLPGFALTGGGAEVQWMGAGSLLWKLRPTTKTTNQEFVAASKDHIHSDPSTVTAYALGIRIEP